MKLFSRTAGTRIVNINGEKVKFVNCVAEVSDEFGEEALKLGLPGLYEHGKQPVYETPKEVAMKSDFKDKEDWYKKELARLKNISEAKEQKIKELTAEVTNWKNEYQKEHDLRVALASGNVEQSKTETVTTPETQNTAETANEGKDTPKDEHHDDEDVNPADEEAALRSELEKMKKAELVKFGLDSGFDMSPVEGKTNAEIIEFLVNASKE